MTCWKHNKAFEVKKCSVICISCISSISRDIATICRIEVIKRYISYKKAYDRVKVYIIGKYINDMINVTSNVI